MIVNCPNCGKQLRMSTKIQESVQKLGPGQKIKIKCVQCQTPFGLDASKLNAETVAVKEVAKKKPSRGNGGLQPPASPDISWLKDGVFEDQEVVEDVPLALVLMPDTPHRTTLVDAVKELGYHAELAPSVEEALNKMRFVNYASVFLHSDYEPGGIESGIFHNYMKNMEMSRRRFVLYVLIGKEFKTLYDLQALSCSANLVVNEEETPYIGTILKKTIPEYEALFGSLIEQLRVSGK